MKLQGFFISNQISKQSFALVLFLFLSLPLYATNWYVDKNASGSNNGTSWTNAWESFSTINWGSVQPGDIVFISGGTDSTVYNSGLNINANGTSTNLVTVRKGWDTGHNGKVVIEGSNHTSGTGISANGQKYLRIVGFTVRTWFKGIDSDQQANVIYWDSLHVSDCNWCVGTCTSGNSSDSLIYRYCIVDANWTTTQQTDAFGGTGCTWLEVRNCYIRQGNRYSWSGHSDVMQNRIAGHQLYYNSWFESLPNYDSSAATGLNGQLNLAADTTLFYNCVMITRGWTYGIFMDQGNTNHTWIMVNNTFIKDYNCSDAGTIQSQQVETFAWNNIFYSTNSTNTNLSLVSLSPGRSNFDYNLYYQPNNPNEVINFGSFSSWQSGGGDPNSPNPGNPLFTYFNPQTCGSFYDPTIDLTLTSGSPAIGAGNPGVKAFIESWGLPWTDFNGNPRSETAPSIGAFENTAAIPVELTSFTATSQFDKIILNWVTATETNNLGFEIDRKQNNSEWEKIGFVDGHGTTTEPKEYSYIDDISTLQGKLLVYRLKQLDFDGSFEYSNVVEVEVTPIHFELSQNYPNPFNPTTAIRYSVPMEGLVTLKVYNTVGEEVIILANEVKQAGIYEVEFDASNLPSGIYFYKLQASSFVQVKKMILLK
jgi:hypothetical protein